MIFIDAGYLVALVKPNDALHDVAVAWSQCNKESTLITDYVVLEAMNLLSKVPDRRRSALLLKILRDPMIEWITARADLMEMGLRLHQDRPDKSWSLTDCISFIIMQQRGITRALAFDVHFEQAGFEALLRRDPP